MVARVLIWFWVDVRLGFYGDGGGLGACYGVLCGF